MTMPVHRRPYRAFVSYSHQDADFVKSLYSWLTDYASMRVWFDSSRLSPSARVGGGLSDAIEQCQSFLVILSPASVASGWVKEEMEFALQHRVEFPAFNIIPVLVGKCDVPGSLKSTKRIELPAASPTLDFYNDLLSGLYADATPPDLENVRDIYVSRGWQDRDAPLADPVCRELIQAGFRLIGDALDQPAFDPERIRSIMRSCGGVAVIVPHRGEGRTSKYILMEIDIARGLKLPIMTVADSLVQLTEPLASAVQATSGAPLPDLTDAIGSLSEDFQRPAKPHSFFATAFEVEHENTYRTVARVVERVTATPCLLGEGIHEEGVQNAILQRISSARFVLADISTDNLNTCIEAGMARGAQTPLHLIAKGPRSRPPFLFRNQEVFYYDDDAQLLGLAHRVAAPYRRRTIMEDLH